MLLVDVTGGTGQFEQTASEFIRVTFPGAGPQRVQPDHPLLRAGNPGMEDLPKRRLRQNALIKYGANGGPLTILSAGKGHIIYSPLDITSGLLGTDTGGILGYEAGYAQSLVKNILFWTLDGQKDQ